MGIVDKEIDLKELPNILDEEIDVYGISNSLDEQTIEELRFIISSLCKFLNKKLNKKSDFIDLLKSFDSSLELVADGVYGTSFKTSANLIYKDLPTIQRLIMESFDELKYKVTELEENNDKLKDSNKSLKEQLKDAKELIDSLKDEVNTLKNRSSRSSSSFYGGSSSYGRC